MKSELQRYFMHGNIWTRCAKELRELCLIKPNSFTLYSYLNARLTTIASVDDNFVIWLLVFHRVTYCIKSSISPAVNTAFLAEGAGFGHMSFSCNSLCS